MSDFAPFLDYATISCPVLAAANRRVLDEFVASIHPAQGE